MSKVDDTNKLLNTVGLHYYTSLLEALGWDEEALNDVIKFTSDFLACKMEEQTLNVNDIQNLLEHVETTWGTSAKESVEGLINFEAFNLNLLNARSEDVN